jgi:hypothetical protein
MSSITNGVYPRFMPVMHSMMALDPKRMKMLWATNVAEIAAA